MTYVQTQHRLFMAIITNEFLKFEPMLKIQIVADSTLFTVNTFNSISSLTQINCIVIQHCHN